MQDQLKMYTLKLQFKSYTSCFALIIISEIVLFMINQNYATIAADLCSPKPSVRAGRNKK